ncbi:MAG: hypothetical protein V4537_17355 [Pseudomonadota bacterium]
MHFFARLSPIRAFLDLRLFLAQRQPYELAFLFLSIVLTTLLIAGFVKDSHIEKPYKRDIQYFQSWPADRTSADIRADQVRDMAVRTKADVTYEKRRADMKASFKRVDDKMTEWGL